MAPNLNVVVSMSLLFVLVGSISPITALRCFSCDNDASALNSECKYLPTDQSATVECGPGITHCFTSAVISADDGSGAFKRGCLDPAATTCESFATDSCEKCTTDLCNSAQLTFDKCASCDTLDCNITSSASKIVQCSQATANRGGCYRYSTPAGEVKRGCVSDLDEETFRVCTEADGETCKTCQGLSCNLKDDFQRCFACDSDIDSDCINLSPNDVQLSRVCKDYMDSCVAFVIPNGKTARGCLKEVDPEPTYCPSTNCMVCPTPDCNYGLVPPTRIQCFQCNSTTDPDCNGSQMNSHFSAPLPCATFKYDDQCYKYWDEENSIGYRGCVSDGDDSALACGQSPERCVKCPFSSCNFDPLLRDPHLWCNQCDRTAACMWSFNSPTKPCEKKVVFYESESCYQYLYAGGRAAKRGCTLEDKELCRDDACHTCTSHFCNRDSYLSQSCVRCSSTNSELCEVQANMIDGERCNIDPNYSQRGCYSFRDETAVLHRGCYFDMEDDWRTNCETTHKDRCTRCYGTNCNTNEQGSGNLSTASKVLIIVMLSVVAWR